MTCIVFEKYDGIKIEHEIDEEKYKTAIEVFLIRKDCSHIDCHISSCPFYKTEDECVPTKGFRFDEIKLIYPKEEESLVEKEEKLDLPSILMHEYTHITQKMQQLHQECSKLQTRINDIIGSVNSATDFIKVVEKNQTDKQEKLASKIVTHWESSFPLMDEWKTYNKQEKE